MNYNNYKNMLIFPVNPTKPFLNHNADSSDARKHADKLKQYEKDKISYRVSREEYDNEEYRLKTQFKFDLFKENGIAKDIDKAEKIFSKAWEDGHSSGYEEITYYFEETLDFVKELGVILK